MGDVWNYKENHIIHIEKHSVNKERDYVINESIFFKVRMILVTFLET